MIHVICECDGLTKTKEGDSLLLLAIPESELTESLTKLEGKRIVVDIKRYSEKRSLNANAYFWKLCSLIAEKVGSNKDEIYRLMLMRYGQYTDIECETCACESVKRLFRASEILSEDFITEGGRIVLRGYFGSSSYTSAEMSRLINGVKQECEDLGIETWSQEEVDRLITEWGER